MKTLEPREYKISDGGINTQGATMVAIDLEMFGQDVDKLHTPHGEFACLSLSLDNGENYIVEDVNKLDAILQTLFPLQWIIQNATYDRRQLRQFVKIGYHPIFDPMLVEKVLWAGYYTLNNLAALSRRYLGVYMEKDKYEAIQTKDIAQEELYGYAVLDAYLTLRVAKEQMKLLDLQPGSSKVYATLDAPMIWVVLDMAPVHVDVDGWRTLAIENESKGRSIEAEIGLNVFSYKTIKEFLAREYSLQLQDTADETLAEYKHLPIIQKIREGRSYRKASSTYGQKWLDDNVQDDAGTVYCDWKVTGAETGRMSSAHQNLQNIPSRKMPVFRTLFVSHYGKMVVADVSQQEPRLTAMISMED